MCLFLVFIQEAWVAAPELFQLISSRKQINDLINNMLARAAAIKVR